tara:strand:- start:5525 stop:6499 length:975 start_codon:yes stop_codon:yes gene_type:complete
VTLDTLILKSLRESETVSGSDLAEQAGVSRAAIWARIKALRLVGYEIDANPHQGYRLTAAPDGLHADDLLARLKPVKTIGREIRVFNKTASTNDIVEKIARDGAPEGVVVFAETQTRGRGRMGRRWVSPAKKGLWFSILLRPNLRTESATQITVSTATALARAISSVIDRKVEIKWPNDLLIDGKKIAGILTEMSAELDGIKYLVVGIGVDVNLSASELPPELLGIATSLRMVAGKKIDRPALAARMLEELDHDYSRIVAGQFRELAEEWENQCVTLGKNVSISIGDQRISGRAESLDVDGSLMVRTSHGRLERIIGGDVVVEK